MISILKKLPAKYIVILIVMQCLYDQLNMWKYDRQFNLAV